MRTLEPRRAAHRRVRIALLALLLAFAAPITAAPRIGLVTMAPGEVYWQRFGHNAILVDDGGRRTLYNYGFFDFSEPGFLPRFLLGKMSYYLVAMPFEEDLDNYAAEGRGVLLQWLDIDAGDARELAAFLAWNARPENARYRYDYFTDNCATRVRDALDRALDGALRARLVSRSRGFTYRSESLRLSAGLPWLYLGIHAGLGPFADRPLSRWQEGFVPARLAEAVREVEIDGRPLVLAEEMLLPHRLGPVPDAPPRRFRWFAAAGIALAALLYACLATRRAAVPAGLALAIFWLATGLGGLALAGLWAFTDHVAAWRNANLLLFDPFALALLPLALARWRGREASRRLRGLALAVAALAACAPLLHLVSLRPQDNADWIALLLPAHVAVALALFRRSRPAGQRDGSAASAV